MESVYFLMLNDSKSCAEKKRKNWIFFSSERDRPEIVKTITSDVASRM